MLRVVFEIAGAVFAVWGWYRLLTDRTRRSRFFPEERCIRVWLYDAESAEFRLRRALSEAGEGCVICVYIRRGDTGIRDIADAFSARYPNLRIILT